MSDLRTQLKVEVLDSFSGPLKKLGLELKSVDKVAGSAGKNFQLAAHIQQASQAVNQFAGKARAAFTTPIETFTEWEHQLKKNQALGDLSGQQLEQLKRQTKDLGSSGRYSALQVGQAQESLVSAGYEVQDVLSLTPKTMQLATAGDLALAEASDILTGSLASFNLKAEDAGRVSDILAQGAAVSKANVGYLSEVIAKAGPIANQLGISLEQTSAAAALFANQNVEASIGGTALRAVMLKLSAPAKDAQKAFGSLGLGGQKLKDLQRELGKGNLPGVLKTIGTQMDKLGLSAEKKMAALEHIFGLEAAGQAQILIDGSMRTSKDGFQGLEQGFMNARGAAEKMARTMDQDTAGALMRAKAQWNTLLIGIGERLAPTVVKLSESLMPIVSGIATWVENNSILVRELGHVGLVVAAGSTALGAFLPSLSTMITATTLLGKAYTGLRAATLFLTPSIVQAKIAALAASPAFTKLSGSFLGQAGLVAGAALAGVMIGRLISEFFDLDNKISDLISTITGIDYKTGRTGDSSLKGEQHYGDGTVLDKTGKVITVGNGDASLAPGVVRRARLNGKTTADEINKWVEDQKKPQPKPPENDPSTEKQTRELSNHMREQTKHLKAIADGVSRSRRNGPAPRGRNPIGEN